MQGDEDPKLFFARVEGKLNGLASFGILMSDREVVRWITRRLPSEVYNVEHRTTLIRPGITRSEMEEIIRAYYANRKTQALEEQKVPAVVPAGTAPLVDPHALAVGGRFQGNSRGRRFGCSSRLNSSCLISSSGSFVVPDSSSNIMRGLAGLGTLDEGGINRNLLRYQERRWETCTSSNGVVPSGIRPRFAEPRMLWRGRVVLVAHTATSRQCRSARMHANVITVAPPPCTGLLQLSRELAALVCRDREVGWRSRAA